MSSRFAEADALFCQRTLRERLMVVLCAGAVVLVAIDSIAIQPVESERKVLDRRIASREEEIPTLEAELALSTRITMTDEERRVLGRLDQVEKQLEAIDSRVAESISALVPPEAIVSLLEDMLGDTPNLRLVQLESRPPEELGAREKPAEGEAETKRASSGLYRHGLRIELEGPYPATVDYLERLESSSWHLLWDRFEYEMQTYPNGRATIDLHTISDRKEWMGV